MCALVLWLSKKKLRISLKRKFLKSQRSKSCSQSRRALAKQNVPPGPEPGGWADKASMCSSAGWLWESNVFQLEAEAKWGGDSIPHSSPVSGTPTHGWGVRARVHRILHGRTADSVPAEQVPHLPHEGLHKVAVVRVLPWPSVTSIVGPLIFTSLWPLTLSLGQCCLPCSEQYFSLCPVLLTV